LGRPIVADWNNSSNLRGAFGRADRVQRPPHSTDGRRQLLCGHRRCGALCVANNHSELRQAGSSIALSLPKIQTAHESALWSAILSALEAQLALLDGTIKAYVLVIAQGFGSVRPGQDLEIR